MASKKRDSKQAKKSVKVSSSKPIQVQKAVRGNPSKLIPVTQRTKREASEISKKGGIASGKARAEKRALKEILQAQLSSIVNGKRVDDGITTALIRSALKGNVKAYEVIRDTIGEKPTDRVKVDAEVVTHTAQEEMSKYLELLKDGGKSE